FDRSGDRTWSHCRFPVPPGSGSVPLRHRTETPSVSDLRPIIRRMSDEVGKHVFISYVHEDSDQVDSLCAVLEAAQIPYWRDRKDLGPGDSWKAQIRAAIRDGSLVFLACFS
ncbi:TIR domain-containing protein, partial [Streptomyces sp. SID8455]|nr:TIR domain-containing protein [Streptomyces sp. SID8455]